MNPALSLGSHGFYIDWQPVPNGAMPANRYYRLKCRSRSNVRYWGFGKETKKMRLRMLRESQFSERQQRTDAH